MNKPPIRLVGFSKKKKLEVTLLLYDHDERKTVNDAYYFFEPDTMIQMWEYNKQISHGELKLEDIFAKPKK